MDPLPNDQFLFVVAEDEEGRHRLMQGMITGEWPPPDLMFVVMAEDGWLEGTTRPVDVFAAPEAEMRAATFNPEVPMSVSQIRKVSQSGLDGNMSHVVRGALYAMVSDSKFVADDA